jgi:polyisoprenoid-binding protein YceI
MKRRVLVAVLLLGALSPFTELFAQPMLLQIRKDDSHFSFSIYKWGVFKEEGRFRDFDGTIEFDPRNPAATKVEVVINTSSIDSRNDNRDRALRSEDFFHVTRYPAMKFKGVGIGTKGRDTLLVEGDLTIKGVTKRLTIPVRLAGVNRVGGELGTLVGFESEFVINREDFNVGEGWSIIDKNARIHLLIGAGSKPTANK